jgi:hypothetical protein
MIILAVFASFEAAAYGSLWCLICIFNQAAAV